MSPRALIRTRSPQQRKPAAAAERAALSQGQSQIRGEGERKIGCNASQLSAAVTPPHFKRAQAEVQATVAGGGRQGRFAGAGKVCYCAGALD
jgi:hypothetical protein